MLLESLLRLKLAKSVFRRLKSGRLTAKGCWRSKKVVTTLHDSTAGDVFNFVGLKMLEDVSLADCITLMYLGTFKKLRA